MIKFIEKICKINDANWKSILSKLSDDGYPLDFKESKLLLYACKNNNYKMAKFLINRGALPKDRESKCLKYAIKFKNCKLATLLISKRARINKYKNNIWLLNLIENDCNQFIKFCELHNIDRASHLLRNGCIPKQYLKYLLTYILNTKNESLLNIFLTESLNKICIENIEWTKLCDECSICLQKKVNIACNPCGHYFHSKCLFKWKCISNSCPLCKSLINKTVSINKYLN